MHARDPPPPGGAPRRGGRRLVPGRSARRACLQPAAQRVCGDVAAGGDRRDPDPPALLQCRQPGRRSRVARVRRPLPCVLEDATVSAPAEVRLHHRRRRHHDGDHLSLPPVRRILDHAEDADVHELSPGGAAHGAPIRRAPGAVRGRPRHRLLWRPLCRHGGAGAGGVRQRERHLHESARQRPLRRLQGHLPGGAQPADVRAGGQRAAPRGAAERGDAAAAARGSRAAGRPDPATTLRVRSGRGGGAGGSEPVRARRPLRRGDHPVRRSRPLHHVERGERSGNHRGGAERVLHGHGGDHLPSGRDAEAVRGRRDHGHVRRALPASRSRDARHSRRRGDEGAADCAAPRLARARSACRPRRQDRHPPRARGRRQRRLAAPHGVRGGR